MIGIVLGSSRCGATLVMIGVGEAVMAGVGGTVMISMLGAHKAEWQDIAKVKEMKLLETIFDFNEWLK
jgi:hypothetical protein